MGEIQRQEYRERIKEGGIVYFAEPNNVTGARIPDFALVVKKATVINAEKERRYPIVLIWKDVDEEPEGGISVAKSPRELFTPEELPLLIASGKELQNKTIDNLVKDAVSNRRLAHILSEVARERLGDNHKRNPRDPEY